MKDIKERGKQLAAKMGFVPDTCGVKGCESGDVDVIELQPLDPIDHHSTLIQLCNSHQEWATERNALAAEIKAELVEKRKEIGQQRLGDVKTLARPQDGDLREDYLLGEWDGPRYVTMSDVMEESK